MKRLVRVGILLAAGLACLAARPAPPIDMDGVTAALRAGRYAEVEVFYARLVRERARNAEGDFLFEQFVDQVPAYSTDDPNDIDSWPKVDALTADWVAHSPDSYLAAMSRARALVRRGEHVDAANGSWAEVGRYAAQARRLVERSRSRGASDANWHAVRLRVASLEGAPRREVLEALQAAIKVDPYPVLLWQEAAFALSPRGRAPEDLAWLMKLAMERTSSKEGSTMYVRVLESTYWFFPDLMARPYARGRLDWGLLKKSYADLRKRYPAKYDPNQEGALACLAGDRSATGAALKAIGDDLHPDVWERWGGKPHLERCKDWVFRVQPSRRSA